MSKVDWSKAGKRIRFQPGTVNRNPDWNWVEKRWKDEADYYAEELSKQGVIDTAECPTCGVRRGVSCINVLADCHTPRRRAAGEALLKARGPRFSKERK